MTPKATVSRLDELKQAVIDCAQGTASYKRLSKLLDAYREAATTKETDV